MRRRRGRANSERLLRMKIAGSTKGGETSIRVSRFELALRREGIRSNVRLAYPGSFRSVIPLLAGGTPERSAFDGLTPFRSTTARRADPMVALPAGGRFVGASGRGARAGTRSSRVWNTYAAWPGAVRVLNGHGTFLPDMRNDDRLRLVHARSLGQVVASQPGGVPGRSAHCSCLNLAADLRLVAAVCRRPVGGPAARGTSDRDRFRQFGVLAHSNPRCSPVLDLTGLAPGQGIGKAGT